MLEHYSTCSKCGTSAPGVDKVGKKLLCLDCSGRSDQTFCIFCQKELGTFQKLKTHLRKTHSGSLPQSKLAP